MHGEPDGFARRLCEVLDADQGSWLPRKETGSAPLPKSARTIRLDRTTLPVMARVNDVGGQSGFGPVAVEPDEPPFHADWEARVYALNVAMLRRGVYNLDQFRDAIERMPPGEYLAASYYERWLHAVEALTSAAADPGPDRA